MEMTQRDSDVPVSSAVLSCSLFERQAEINRIRSAAEADGILLRACGTLDLYNDRSGNAAQRAVLLCKPGIGKRDCRLAAAERRARDRAVTQEGMALGREHIGAAQSSGASVSSWKAGVVPAGVAK